MKRKLRLAAPRMGTVKRTPSALAAYLFLAPSLAGVTIFLLAPFVETVRRSFCDTLGKNFVGLANYRFVLSNTAFRLGRHQRAAFHRRMCAAALASEPCPGTGTAYPGAERHPLGRVVPHNLSFAHGHPGGQHRPSMEGTLCAHRPDQQCAGNRGGFHGHRGRVLGFDCHLSLEKHRLRQHPLVQRAGRHLRRAV